MSALPASRPVRPGRLPTAPARAPLHVVPTRAQKRRRPRAAYAAITVVSVFAIFAGQLLLSIAVSDGAYQIAHLQDQQKELLRTQEALTESIDVQGSSQSLAVNAASLGMVPATEAYYLDVSTGAVVATPGIADRSGCGGACNAVANALLAGMVPIATQVAAAKATAAAAATAPHETAAAGSTAPASSSAASGSANAATTPTSGFVAPVTH